MARTWRARLLVGLIGFTALTASSIFFVYRAVTADLPQIISVKDYDPLTVSEVFDRSNKKVGEFFFERRTLLPYKDIPKDMVNAFLAAEDDQFFKHGGLNYAAIFRAFMANVRAGRTVQGGSTITQQVAKTFFLSNERKFFRKLQEALLSLELEKNLTKEDILYLYLNQIYFGNSAYGVENAARTYFQKPAKDLNLSEIAILAGLPKAPSEYSPVVNPKRAKERQVYVLKRMAEVGFISEEVAKKTMVEPVKVFVKENYDSIAPFYLESVRQLLVDKLGEDLVLKKGIKIYTALDASKQKAAQESLVEGLKALDKRQGFRGALREISGEAETSDYFAKYKRKLIQEITPERTITPEGEFAEVLLQKQNADQTKKTNLPGFLELNKTYEALITEVRDDLGLVYLKLPDTQGVIDFESMKWARKPNIDKRFDLDQITKASEALKAGELVHVKVVGEKPSFTKALKGDKKAVQTPVDLSSYLHLELDQEPLAEGALLSIDQQTQEVLAIVGGYSFARSKLIRAFQAIRQTGSSFKTIVYASALDRGYTPATPIMDAPVVFDAGNEDNEGQNKEDPKVWKPSNYEKNFGGEIIFRNALVQSLNIPTVKILEDVGVPWVADYAKRLGVFSPLNMDFSLALGSSSLSLYEMTKVFSQFGRLGQRTRPLVIKKVVDRHGKTLLQNVSLDERFMDKLKPMEDEFETRKKAYQESLNPAENTEIIEGQTQAGGSEGLPEEQPPQAPQKKEKIEKFFMFPDQEQLIRPQTAYVMTTLLKGVIEDRRGTGGRARALGREVAGKTGTTNNYVDAWFIGYTSHIATGVWVGFDKERSLGRGEVGGRAALPIWLDYMKFAHESLPPVPFSVPEGIVFANIDLDTGHLASATSKSVLRQAFIEGTEPSPNSKSSQEDNTDFLKRDLTE